MDYPSSKERSTVVRIPEGLDEAMEEFLKTTKAKRLGFRYKSDLVNVGVRDLLMKHGFFAEPVEEPPYIHHNVYEDHVTLFDKKINRLIDIYFRNGKVYCTYDEAEECDHVKFVFTIPKVAEMLNERGWRIIEGRILKRPS